MKSMEATISCIVIAPSSCLLFTAIICSAMLQLQLLHVHHLLAWFVLMLLLALSSACLAHWMICVPLQTASIVLPKSSNVPSFLSGQEPYLSKLCLDDDIAVTLIILGFFNAFLKNDTQVYECKILSIQKEPAALRKKVSHLSSPGNYFRNCSVKNKSCIKHHKHHSFGVMVFLGRWYLMVLLASFAPSLIATYFPSVVIIKNG